MKYKSANQELCEIRDHHLNTKKFTVLVVLEKRKDDFYDEIKSNATDIKFNFVKSILQLGKEEHIRLRKYYVVGLFQSTQDALFSAQKLKYASKILNISVKIGLDYGPIYHNSISYQYEAEGSYVDAALRLASVAQSDEIVLSESLYGDSNLDHKRFVLIHQRRHFTSLANREASENLTDCYVMMLINDR